MPPVKRSVPGTERYPYPGYNFVISFTNVDTGTEMVTATNSVWHSRGFASHLVLPEIPGHS